MNLKLSEVLRIYNNQRMSIYDILNRPILPTGEPFDPLVDLVGESFFGMSQLERVEGHILEVPIVLGQSLIAATDRDPRTFFKIEKGYHEWIQLPSDERDKELLLAYTGNEFRKIKEYGFIFTQFPESWSYDNNRGD